MITCVYILIDFFFFLPNCGKKFEPMAFAVNVRYFQALKIGSPVNLEYRPYMYVTFFVPLVEYDHLLLVWHT